MTTPYDDPFAGARKLPSISFKGAPDGTTYDLIVKSVPKLVQSRDYESGEPATWPDGNPKMSIVIEVVMASTGEERSVWAAKPGSLFTALADAQIKAGARIEPEGRLRITKTHEVPNAKNPKLNDAKQYAAQYAPHDPFAGAPEWAQPGNVTTPQSAGHPAATTPPAATNGAASATTNGGMDPAVAAALANLNPQVLAALAAQVAQQ